MRVITFSRIFPIKHPRKGEPTYFVEKIWRGLNDNFFKLDSFYDVIEHNSELFESKCHTIRSGNRWKAGDWFSPRVWSGKPYQSKQIQFAPDLQVKKVFEFEYYGLTTLVNGNPINSLIFNELAKNDGLTSEDFINWFKCHPKLMKDGFKGQIICWNENVHY